MVDARRRPISTRSTALVRTFKRYLHDWGYRGELVREDFPFGQEGADRRVALAAFAHLPADARTSCIAVLEVSKTTASAEVSACRELGAPVVFACHEDGIDWWKQEVHGPVRVQPVVPPTAIDAFAREHKQLSTFAPRDIYRAKTQSRLDPQLRLPFVDEHLMPTIERSLGERLGKVIDGVFAALKQEVRPEGLSDVVAHQLLKDAFWLIAAKILRDKGVPSFAGLELTDVRDVFARVRKHYDEPKQLFHSKPTHISGLSNAAAQVARLNHLGQVTTEALAYVYENTLITDELRRTLGIHSTPPYLTDYILGRLEPYIAQVPQEDRHVFEPACGHGAFLVAAMRRLRDLLPEPGETHAYLQRHLHGLEIDPTAIEIARLSLTLADIPNPDGWQLHRHDMFSSAVFATLTAKAKIFLANPPYEDFTPVEKERYRRARTPISSENRAEEMLQRALSLLSEGAVFGVVVPQALLRSKSGTALRELMMRTYAIDEILLLPDKVFTFADVEAAVLIGHKMSSADPKVVHYRRVREPEIVEFRETYSTRSDRMIPQRELMQAPAFDLRLPDFYDIWSRGRDRTLANVAVVGRGLEHHGKDLPEGVQTSAKKRFAGAVRGYARVGRTLSLHGHPEEVWLNIRDEAVRRPNLGIDAGRPQVLVNHRPTDRGPWRLKAVIDRDGHATRDVFLIVRPISSETPLELLWALCNASYANAYVFDHATKRDIDIGVLRAMPVPHWGPADVQRLVKEVQAYLRAAQELEQSALKLPAEVQRCQAMLRRIDALVLRLYDLPPRLERRLLDLFDDRGDVRSGVPTFEPPLPFLRYLPKGFVPCVPLYVHLAMIDPDLADMAAVEERSGPLALEKISGLSQESLDSEIAMLYEELASLNNYRDEIGSSPALQSRAAAQEIRLRMLQEEDVRRLSATFKAKLLLPPEDGPDLLDRAAQLLEEYGYTPRANSAVSKKDPEEA